MHDADDFRDWFRLLQTPGVGRDGARRLLASFGSAASVLGASAAALREVVGDAVAAALAREPEDFAPRLATALDWWRADASRHVLCVGDADYPSQLLQCADPPLLLFVHGRVDLLSRPGVAIVGSRNASAQGVENARAFAAHLSAQQWCIVSGMAAGIDCAAHEGGLSGPGGTVAVLGTGPDRVYPSRNRELARRIAATGALVSEYAPGTPPLPEHFPLRNRIIAALTRGTLVVEAALRSGSLITARLAAEYGREVFAVPGSIHSPLSRGCHALIRQGAKLVESGADILDELQPGSRPAVPAANDVPSVEQPLLEAMGFDPVNLDALGARTGLGAAELSVKLLELELEGRVARLPGGLYQRLGRG